MGLCRLAVMLVVLPPTQPDASKDALDIESQKIVRDSVYDHDLATATPPGKFNRVLLVPAELTEVYKKHPQAVLQLLSTIVDGGCPKDSALAAAYVLELSIAPGNGVVIAENFDAKTYDVIDQAWKKTPRMHWMGRVQLRLQQKRTGK